MYTGHIKALSLTRSCCMTIINKYNKYMFVFMPSLYDIQIPNFLRSIILSSVVCPAVPYLSPLLQNRYDIRKKIIIEYKSSSSLTRQPLVGPGLLKKLCPFVSVEGDFRPILDP